jgi:hypothetical protein
MFTTNVPAIGGAENPGAIGMLDLKSACTILK